MTNCRSPRTVLALMALRSAALLSRRLGRGSGSIIGGRVALLLCPSLIERLGHEMTVVLVSGTNGKTTTTRLLVEALGGTDRVATSTTGSNMPAGIVTAIARRVGGQTLSTAVLEVDEAYLPLLIDQLSPAAVVLLNLSRDQLDRIGEVRMIAHRWREALANSEAMVVANADDPLVVYAAGEARWTTFVGAGNHWREDAFHCPRCDGRISFSKDRWSCSCGFARPNVIADYREGELRMADGRSLPINSQLPGEFNRENLAIAAIAATVIGEPLTLAIERMEGLAEVAGRFSVHQIGEQTVRLMLAKNPAGWTSLLELACESEATLLLAINARVADGHDPSWLFDVPFELLAGRHLVTSGERRFDLGVRLRHAGLPHEIGAILPQHTLGAITDTHIDIIANYTAFQDLRRALVQRQTTVTPAPLPQGGPEESRVRSREGDARSPLQIVVVYPELLGTYGDSGNAAVLVNRARWRGIDAELVEAHLGDPLPRDGAIYLLGGGEDGPQVRATEELRSEGFGSILASGTVVFAVCAGYQILGHTFPAADGQLREGLGILDVTTVRPVAPRAVGEIAGECRIDGIGVLTGFENHASHTILGAGVEPLMNLSAGIGNGASSTDGAISGHVIGSYLHGPALARNPALADYLLSLATGRTIPPLRDLEEQSLRHERLSAAGLPNVDALVPQPEVTGSRG